MFNFDWLMTFQVSFVNSINLIKGGTHVDYVTNQITNYVMSVVNKKNKNANLKAHAVKIHLWVFVNALIDNPAFDSQTKETLTIRQSSFGSKCELSQEFPKKGLLYYFEIFIIIIIIINFKKEKLFTSFVSVILMLLWSILLQCPSLE